MKPKNIFLTAITFLLCAFFFISCEEKEKVWTELPPATQTGANTIGCMVDGKLWATGKLPGYTLRPRMMATYTIVRSDSAFLDFYAEGKEGGIGFRIINPILGENPNCNLVCNFSFRKECDDFLGRKIANVNITKLDLQNKILSGTFNSKVYCEKDSSVTANLTDGRFDMYLYVNK